jgi:hypothetical protein
MTAFFIAIAVKTSSLLKLGKTEGVHLEKALEERRLDG